MKLKKELLISIKPEHLVNILNGKKTLELRKTVPKDYKGWVNIYCTKGVGKTKHHHLYNLTEYNNGKTLFAITHHNKYSLVPDNFLNGKVVARFWFDEYDTYDFDNHKGKTLYVWHIKNLEIFDKPKELSEFYKNDSKWSVHYYIWSITDCILLEKYSLTKAPQSYQFVYVKE